MNANAAARILVLLWFALATIIAAPPKRPVTRGMKPTPAVMRLAQPAAVFATGEMDELLDSR